MNRRTDIVVTFDINKLNVMIRDSLMRGIKQLDGTDEEDSTFLSIGTLQRDGKVSKFNASAYPVVGQMLNVLLHVRPVEQGEQLLVVLEFDDLNEGLIERVSVYDYSEGVPLVFNPSTGTFALTGPERQ